MAAGSRAQFEIDKQGPEPDWVELMLFDAAYPETNETSLTSTGPDRRGTFSSS